MLPHYPPPNTAPPPPPINYGPPPGHRVSAPPSASSRGVGASESISDPQMNLLYGQHRRVKSISDIGLASAASPAAGSPV